MLVETESRSRPCWPVIWLLVVSVAQYGYRYIFQVNDPSTSSQYEATPPAFSAIKYEILVLFVAYSLFSFFRHPVSISAKYREMICVSCYTFFALIIVLVVRLAVLPGALADTGVCALQLGPSMACVLFIPFVFRQKHDLAGTLAAFERIVFWIAFPFWIITVLLVIFGIRYPALSYPGALIRFGGVLDDPNGYACLCLLLLTLAIKLRRGKWGLRAGAYVVMTLGTLSITGYIVGLVMILCLLPSAIRKSKPLTICLGLLTAASLIALPVWLYVTNPAIVDGINFLYSGKSNSAATHLSALYPDDAMLDVSSPVTLLVGVGGFSENFYWRILANFGWIGLVSIVAMTSLWAHCALRSSRWQSSIGSWIIGVLVGSNGIAYLLTFPLNLIYWCSVSMMLQAGESP